MSIYSITQTNSAGGVFWTYFLGGVYTTHHLSFLCCRVILEATFSSLTINLLSACICSPLLKRAAAESAYSIRAPPGGDLYNSIFKYLGFFCMILFFLTQICCAPLEELVSCLFFPSFHSSLFISFLFCCWLKSIMNLSPRHMCSTVTDFPRTLRWTASI